MRKVNAPTRLIWAFSEKHVKYFFADADCKCLLKTVYCNYKKDKPLNFFLKFYRSSFLQRIESIVCILLVHSCFCCCFSFFLFFRTKIRIPIVLYLYLDIKTWKPESTGVFCIVHAYLCCGFQAFRNTKCTRLLIGLLTRHKNCLILYIKG